MFAQPKTTEEALTFLSKDKWHLLAGGTDFYPTLGNSSPSGNVLDISKLHNLRTIYEDKTHWHIGALVTWSDVIKTNLPASFDALKLCAREVGSIPIQNRATVVGNICNASPAADGMPALLCLDTIVRVSSSTGTRDVPLHEFVIGNRQTTLGTGEMVTEILVPKASAVGFSNFHKLGARKYLVISIVMVATRLDIDSRNCITDAGISVGSCSVVARRLHKLERELIGQELTNELSHIIQRHHITDLKPINDVRSTSDYRLEAAVQLLRQSLDSLVRKS